MLSLSMLRVSRKFDLRVVVHILLVVGRALLVQESLERDCEQTGSSLLVTEMALVLLNVSEANADG